MRGVPAEEVGKDLPLKNVGKKSMDPVAALQDDAGQGRRCPHKAGMTWWGKALPRGHGPLIPPHRQFVLFNFSCSERIVMPLTFSLIEINGSLLYKGLLKSTKSKKSFLFF